MATGLCALAREKLSRYVRELRTPGTVEKATTAIKAGYVGSIVTPLRAVAGNTSWGALRHLVNQPAEAGVDLLLSTAKSARTGFKVPPHEFREVVSALDKDGLSVMLRGFGKGMAPTREAATAARQGFAADRAAGVGRPSAFGRGIARFVEELSTRLDAENVAKVVEFDRVKYQNPVLQTMVDGAFGVLEAADRPYWKLGFDGSLYMQAKLLAVREGATGAERAARAKAYFESPTMEMVARATDDANYATFKDENLLSRKASEWKGGLKATADKNPTAAPGTYEHSKQWTAQLGAKAASYGVETNLPFTGVPSSVAYKVAAQGPLGFLNIPKLMVGQAERARALATAGVGTAMWAVGYQIAATGRLTGAFPTSPAEKAQWELEGKQPWSVKIGDTWTGLNSLGPAAIPLFMGGNLHRLKNAEPDASPLELAWKEAAFVGNIMTEQTYTMQLKRIIDAFSNERGAAASLVASQVPVPSIVGQVTRAADPYQRDTRRLEDRLTSRLPGGAFVAPKRIDAFGEPVRKTPLERAASILSPFPLKASRDTPLLIELRRLGVTVGKPQRTLRFEKKSIERSDDEYEKMLTEVGPEVHTALEKLIRDPDYADAPDEAKVSEIKRIIRDAHAKANDDARLKVYEDVRRGKDTRITSKLRQ